MQPWVAEELSSADLNDDRLNARFHLILDRLSLKPSLKFTAACKGRSEIDAAYRFVNRPRVTPARLLRPHHDATLQRMRQHKVVLCIQDTTENDLTRPNERVEGAGPLNDSDRWGFFVHPLLAITPQRVPLGLVGVKIWARDPLTFDKPSPVKAAERKKKPIDEKESIRWVEGYRQACTAATACPDTRVVCIGDSENDIFECFFEAQAETQLDAGQRRAEWIIRAAEDRALLPIDENDKGIGHLFEQVARAPVVAELEIDVSQRDAKSSTETRKRRLTRTARRARMTVQARRVKLRQPDRPGGKKMVDVEVNAVLVREVNPPAGEEPIEWLLLTSLPIDSAEQVLVVVEYYCCRWQIEIYFRVLKSGCKVEESQLEKGHAYRAYLSLCLIVAWRVMYVTMLGRECPELSCEAVLDPDEWQAVYAVVKEQTPPQTPPSLGEMVLLIAMLGGYLGRKNDPPPGPKAMWVGMQRMTDLALGWRARVLQGTAEPGKKGAGRQVSPGPAPPDPAALSPTVQSYHER
jgi:hypothetical protein